MRIGEERTARQPGRRGADAYVFFFLNILSLVLLIFSTRSFVIDVKEIGFSVFSGLRGGISSVGFFVSRTVGSIQELTNLRREYLELVKRIEHYEVVQRDAAEIKKENIRLREQLGFIDTISYRQIPARIIGRDPDNLFSAFVIDKGSKHGIKRNMPVVSFRDGNQGLVGKVVQVGRSDSLIMPIYDASAFVSARLSQSRYEGIVGGQGSVDRPLVMSYIKKRAREEISYGDTVVTSGLGGVFPKDIMIGRVIKLRFQDYDTSINVELEPIIDFSRLEYVFALHKDIGPESND